MVSIYISFIYFRLFTLQDKPSVESLGEAGGDGDPVTTQDKE
jgi:hypothetical protein